MPCRSHTATQRESRPHGIGGGNTVQSHAGMSFHVNGIVNGPGSLALGGVDEGDDDGPPGVADDLGI